MTKRVAKPRTNELLLELREYVFSDKTLNDIEFAMYKKEASQLPTHAESSLIEVMAYCATSNIDEAKDKALSVARRFSNNPEVTSNLIGPMLYLGKPTVAYEIIKQMPLERADEGDIENIFSVNFLFNDLGIDAKLNHWLQITEQSESFAEELKATEARRRLVNDIESRFEVSSDTIKDLSLLAARTVENHCGIIINCTQLEIPPASNNATLTIYVECKPEQIFDLNWDLSGALVDEDLDEIRCIPHFELLKNEYPSLKSRVAYAD